MRKSSLVLGIGVLCLAGCNTPQRQLERRWVGRPAPDFKLAGLDGADIQLSSFRGRPVVLAFWAYN